MKTIRTAVLLLLLFGLAQAQQITLWTTEEQPERLEIQNRIASDFEAQTGIGVEVVPVTESAMGERATAAFAAGELPDVIFHPLSRTIGWAQEGILDTFAATDVVLDLGEDTFVEGSLDLVAFQGGYAAVPHSGWTQLLLYRADLFEEHGLEPPTSYEAIREAIDVLHDPPEMYGFVAATDPNEDYMMQVFEHIALANGVRLVDEEGNVTLDSEAMVETLEFYKDLVEASPPGNLYWQQSRELYFAGDAAMIIWSPFILDELAGLRDEVPVVFNAETEGASLADRTGIVSQISGPSNPEGAGWADMRYYGITIDADLEAAKQFVEYSMSEGYVDTLSIAPEGTFPLRRGPDPGSREFVEQWSQLDVGVSSRAPLAEVFEEEVINDIVAGLENADRWGYSQGQGALVSSLYGTRVISELVREFIDGERSAQETAQLMQQEVAALQQ
ncbi:MAG TPA: extracellular solute-binding protein [Trueperaceae bacterium]